MVTIQQLLNVIPTDRQHAIHANQIAQALGLSTSGTCETTRALIREANMQGYFIVNTVDEGFWLTSDKQEIVEYLDSLLSRIIGTQERINAIKTHWNSTNPQNLI